MPTFIYDDPIRKSDFPKWAAIEHFDMARKAKKQEKIVRLRARYWRENGAYLVRCVVRCMRNLCLK